MLGWFVASPDSVCSIVCSRVEQDFSPKDYTCNTCFRAPLPSFEQVLLLFWDGWAQGSTCISSNWCCQKASIPLQENNSAWACISLLLYITLLITFWDVKHKTRSFGHWARSAAGTFWSSVIKFDWHHLEILHCHLIAAVKNEAFPCHTVLCAQKENLDSEFIQQQLSQWQIVKRCKKPKF